MTRNQHIESAARFGSLVVVPFDDNEKRIAWNAILAGHHANAAIADMGSVLASALINLLVARAALHEGDAQTFRQAFRNAIDVLESER